MPTIVVRVSILPANAGSFNEQIDRAISTACSIFGLHGISVGESGRTVLDSGLLTRDLQDEAVRLSGISGRPIAEEVAFLEGTGATREASRQTARAAMVAAQGYGDGFAGNEARGILSQNRVVGEVATYWVPRLLAGTSSSAGHTVCAPFYPDIPAGLEGIFIRQGAPAPTLAHELGHLLMRAGHCALPDSHEGRTETVSRGAAPPIQRACHCARPMNLMHEAGDTRTGSSLTGEQVRRLLRVGFASGYLRG
jgi:hypothetical protein